MLPTLAALLYHLARQGFPRRRAGSDWPPLPFRLRQVTPPAERLKVRPVPLGATLEDRLPMVAFQGAGFPAEFAPVRRRLEHGAPDLLPAPPVRPVRMAPHTTA